MDTSKMTRSSVSQTGAAPKDVGCTADMLPIEGTLSVDLLCHILHYYARRLIFLFSLVFQ
jgi:hypothetical protein